MTTTDSVPAWAEFYARSFDPDSLRDAADHIARGEGWLLHVTREGVLQDVRERGLRPGFVDGSSPPQPLIQSKQSCEVLCFRPLDHEGVLHVSKPGPLVTLAVSTKDAPRLAGLDWTFPDSLAEAEQLWIQDPSMPLGELVREVGRLCGSIAYYGEVASNVLRIRSVTSSPKDPSTWPLLIETRESDIYREMGDIDVMSMPDPLAR